MRVSLALVLFGMAAASVRAQSSVPTVARLIPPQTLAPAGPALSLDLTGYFTLPDVTGQIVQFDTVMGKFNVELRADAAPREVQNFLNYVQNARYNNSFFHRSASLDSSGAISIVQGGGFVTTPAGPQTIPADAPVPLEYNLPNERGTIAAARTSDPNSATSQWYFNVRDNTSILGQNNGGGYTVFGRVLGTGMTVVDAIAALPRVNAGGGDPSSPFTELPVRNYTSGTVAPANLVVVNFITPLALFPDALSPGVFSFSVQSSATNVVTATLSGSSLTLTPAAAGNATVTITAADVNGNTVNSSFAVTVSSAVPTITAHPVSQTIAAGHTVVFSASASAANTYQWQRNSADVPGATDSTLVIKNVTAADAGNYSLVARNESGTAVSGSATLTISNPLPSDVSRLMNLSIRSGAGVGAQTLIVGFALGGAGTAGSSPLLLRGMGPSLTAAGLTNVLADPVATLYAGETVVASNDNWGGDAQIEARRIQVGAFPFASPTSLDAALAVSPNAGTYTMQVTGAGGATSGTALAEIYDATAPANFTATTPRLVNVSARTQTGTGDNILIGSFVIRGATSETVLIRAVGPTLAKFGVTGTLANPKLRLVQIGASGTLAENDDWAGSPPIVAAAHAVGAFPLVDGASQDAAILVTLPPGDYSAQVSGSDGGTGVALVEVYEVE